MVLQRESIRERVRQVLLERILDGTYKPGDRLVELQIAKEFNVSQAPVREALRELEASRLIESEAYRGTRVREVSLRELQESYQVRGALEALAARLAAGQFQASPKELLTIHKAYRAAARSKDPKRFAETNAAFHRLIVEASGNAVLLRTWDSLSFETLTRLSIQRMHPADADWAIAIDEHQVIVDALIAGDGSAAERLMQCHAETVLSLMGSGKSGNALLEV